MIGDPATAHERADLTFLRRRARPRATVASAPPATASPAAPASGAGGRPAAASSSGRGINYTRPGRSAPAPPPSAQPGSKPTSPASTPTAPVSNPLDLTGAPADRLPADRSSVDYHHRRTGGGGGAATGGGLDLSEPARPTAAMPSAPAAPPSGSLDLSEPTSPAARAPAAPAASSAGRGLDLSARAAPPGAAPRVPDDPRHRVRRDARLSGRTQRLLSVKEPTVTLTRAQSGVGHLAVEAVCSPSVGDLRLGVAYQLRSGGSGIVQHADGHRFGPSARRPVIAGSREEYERVGIDLRQVYDIERIAVYAYSESRVDLQWGGTLLVELFGGSRIELPLETLYPGAVAVLMSLYNMDGEIVVRAEMETIGGDIREAARAYGYDRITWRDERSPVD